MRVQHHTSNNELNKRQKIKKESGDLNSTIHQLDLIAFYRLYPAVGKCKLLTSAHGTFSRMDTMLGHKIASVNVKG